MKTKVAYAIAGVLAVWVWKAENDKKAMLRYIQSVGAMEKTSSETFRHFCPHVSNSRMEALCFKATDLVMSSSEESEKLYEKLR